MSINKDLFINSIKLVEVDERTNIPTVIAYSSDTSFIGYQAFNINHSTEYLIENFKLELGNQDPSVLNKQRFQTGKLQSKSAHEITKDFMETALKKAENWIDARGYKKAARILVAEPIAMGEKETVKSSWLSNYRGHIKRILDHKFENVDFLPEPFAVFQYYRYGVKHNLVAQKQKHVALVLDFGGGTFDVSVIETTASGDVSAGGRNSKPLAASSRPIGGFYINRVIAESLLFESIEKNINKADCYQAVRKFYELSSSGENSASVYREDYKNFFRHFKQLLIEVEKAKVLVCNQIQNWGLESQFRVPVPSYPVNVPTNPLKEKTEYASVKLDAYKLRDIFTKKIWSKELKPAICDALVRAETELKGQPISIILLSGGSSNIRWLSNLLRTDLIHKLPDAEVLELQENFQEIVAKGLAVECARRTYNEGDGDFKSVTYNRLSLSLNPDGKGIEIKKFKPVTDGLPNDVSDEGVLLPSSSILGSLIDQPLRWKVKLSRPPKQTLDYYFMRSSFDHEDTENTFNLDHTTYTKAGTKFDSNIQVELTLKEDGTAYPTFIYKDGTNGEPSYKSIGRPFYMDMTSGTDDGVGEAYLGLDFGSSNSSISYVERSAVSVYQTRSRDAGWLEFNDLVELLPYPVAAPLAKYIAGGNSVNQDLLALDAIEAFLGFAAFLTYQEYCGIKTAQTKLFKGFKQRSAGPLWGLLRDTQKSLGGRANFSKGFKRLFDEPYYGQIDRAITELADFKHGKMSTSIDHFNILKILGNATNKVMEDKIFGSFEDVRKQAFGKKGFVGSFRSAMGKNPPFIYHFSYEGMETFSDEEIFIIDKINGHGMRLSPLFFWAQNLESTRVEFQQLYIYDIEKNGAFNFKATELSVPLLMNAENEYAEYYEHLSKMKEFDIDNPIIENLTLNSINVES